MSSLFWVPCNSFSWSQDWTHGWHVLKMDSGHSLKSTASWNVKLLQLFQMPTCSCHIARKATMMWALSADMNANQATMWRRAQEVKARSEYSCLHSYGFLALYHNPAPLWQFVDHIFLGYPWLIVCVFLYNFSIPAQTDFLVITHRSSGDFYKVIVSHERFHSLM